MKVARGGVRAVFAGCFLVVNYRVRWVIIIVFLNWVYLAISYHPMLDNFQGVDFSFLVFSISARVNF